ncbi:MAG: hypothetical protein FWC58_12130 [Desulfobulbus sp.]|nr:hypothetical protein [Desulfobulbus sp.]
MDAWFLAFIMTVALLIAVGGALVLVGYLGTLPASFDAGWRYWLPAMLLPVLGPLWFASRHWRDFAKPGKQLLGGVLLLALAVGLLYGAGPHFVDRMAAGVK